MDLTDFESVSECVDRVRPDLIFHLAGRPEIARSFGEPAVFFQDNLIGTANLLEAMRRRAPAARMLVASTCEVYGLQRSLGGMREDHPMDPMSPYGASKAAADIVSLTYARVYNLHIVVSRLFNLINPRRADLFSSQFACQVAEIEAGKKHELVYGNLDSARTLLDVRDVVRGYWMLINKGRAGEAYNIGSPREIRIKDFIDKLTAKASCTIPRRRDDGLLRPVDIPVQVADSSKFRAATGWEPEYTLDESIDFLLSYWRERVAQR